jgi:hypothetical protein
MVRTKMPVEEKINSTKGILSPHIHTYFLDETYELLHKTVGYALNETK